MSERDNRILLADMLDHAREAMSFCAGKTRSDLDSDRKLALALVTLILIIGEAANRVPKEEQTLHPWIPWKQIIGTRNRLIHGYDRIDLDILWSIVSEDLPRLTEALERILSGRG